MWRKWIHHREREMLARSTNRRVLPFEWGTEFLVPTNGVAPPGEALSRYVEAAVRDSASFYDPKTLGAPDLAPSFRFAGSELTFQSPIDSPWPENNRAHFHYFPARSKQPAVLVLPQWNADERAHVTLCRWLARVGISALRMTLPYHGPRKPPHLERSDYMISPNIGRTIQAVRQAVLDLRVALDWLQEQGHTQLGIVGTSIGSCIAFIALCHEPRLELAVCNHVSGFFADPVWTGITTRHVREGIEPRMQLEELRRCWSLISPISFADRLRDERRRRVLMISARHDLSFLPHLSEQFMEACRKNRVAHDVVWLPCGHYTIGEFPFNLLDGWHIISYLKKNLGRSHGLPPPGR